MIFSKEHINGTSDCAACDGNLQKTIPHITRTISCIGYWHFEYLYLDDAWWLCSFCDGCDDFGRDAGPFEEDVMEIYKKQPFGG